MTTLITLSSLCRVAISFLLLVCASNVRSETLVSVVQYSFCRDVSNLAPVAPLSDSVVLSPGQKLNLWVELRVNRSGLKYLRALGKLPIYVRWGRDGWLTDPQIDIGIPAVASTETSYVTWRTFTYKAAYVPGRYYVSILDANMKLITSVDVPTTPFRPEIVVTRTSGDSK